MKFFTLCRCKNPKRVDQDDSGGVASLRPKRVARPQLAAINSAAYLQLHPALIPEDEVLYV